MRVSTSKQETSNQRQELEAVAARSGWQIVQVFEDAGISGAKGRNERPGLDVLLKAVNGEEFDMVAAWSVDRLGRSLTDLLGILQALHDKGVDLFLHQQGLDTSTTAGKAMFQMLGVFAEFERGIIRERVNAGLARARASLGQAGRGSTHTRPEGRRHGHPEDRPHRWRRNLRGVAGTDRCMDLLAGNHLTAIKGRARRRILAWCRGLHLCGVSSCAYLQLSRAYQKWIAPSFPK
jgi:DNA invertase Pin-like site-specific DNA recombinase